MKKISKVDSVLPQRLSEIAIIPLHSDQKYSKKARPTQPAGRSGKHTVKKSPILSSMRILIVIFITLFLSVAYYEIKSSTLHAKFLSTYSSTLKYFLADGPSDTIVYPKNGPYDIRLGYVQLPSFIDKLQHKEMRINKQVQFNHSLQNYSKHGFYVPYREKNQAGLHLLDTNRKTMYQMINPKRTYIDFDNIPHQLVQTLLFIENRNLLSDQYPHNNPAVDWGRFVKALMVQAGEVVNIALPTMGGSTLATQIEKFRHSNQGITASAKDKLIQMASASIRAYHNGEDTTAFRKQLVVDYINSVPLSAAPGTGEVNGLGDGMYVWYGADFEEMNRILNIEDAKGLDLELQGKTLKQVISLMVAHRRPSYYLIQNHNDLAALSNSYIRLLAKNNIISEHLSAVATIQPLIFRNFRKNPATPLIVVNKGVNVVRNRLVSLLGTSLYDLDRMDITVTTTLNNQLQEDISQYLKNLKNPVFAKENGLIGRYLLTPDQVDDISYSFTLFEQTPTGNMVRVQTDTTDLPFDINEGSKLELGSTAKLRTLTTYLEIITEIYTTLSQRPRHELLAILQQNPDTLTLWGCNQLLQYPKIQLKQLLDAAMLRQYSANPAERFFTGGGMHIFSNFKKEDNNRVATVAESLQYSINLPFIRIMQDIVKYIRARQWENTQQLLLNDKDQRRKEVLNTFIDQESKIFLARFWDKYKDKTTDQRLEILMASMHPTVLRLTIVHKHLFPDASEAAYIHFIRNTLPSATHTDKQLSVLYEKYRPEAYSLQDMAYLASIHPLELWLLCYLQEQGNKSLKDATLQSTEIRRLVYSWLIRTKIKNARDSRIKTVLEIDAFSDIHRRWKKTGYPFEQLVPSLATALGSSGDKPAALAEFIGIILNNGKRMPTYRFTSIEFAKSTPYETIVEQSPAVLPQILAPEVAQILKEIMEKVVSAGTAKRLSNCFQQDNGKPIHVGGKTGTGDNRIVTSTSSGHRTSSKTLNRTATFVFYLGDNHFGTLTTFVSGDSSKAFSFTSALPLQALKGMAPILQPYINSSNFKTQSADKLSDNYSDNHPENY